MDILNWLYLAKNKFVRTTLGSTKDLMIFGSKVGFNKRGDLYQNYAMSAEDFTTEVSNVVKPYKVYTALLTQSGGNSPLGISSGAVTKGVTYTPVTDYPASPWDFSNVGGPIYPDTTPFVATSNDVPNNWGGTVTLGYNAGAPVVTVLENTIGNVWWEYYDVGIYNTFSNNLFIENKTALFIGTPNDNSSLPGVFDFYRNSDDQIQLLSFNMSATVINGQLANTPIEIRVYN